MTWSATKKEVERSNFFKEVPKIMKRCDNFLAFFRTQCPHMHVSTVNQVLVLGPSFGSYPWLHGCMCHIIGATWMAS